MQYTTPRGKTQTLAIDQIKDYEYSDTGVTYLLNNGSQVTIGIAALPELTQAFARGEYDDQITDYEFHELGVTYLLADGTRLLVGGKNGVVTHLQ